MANLDKLLRKLEQNKENAEKTTTHELKIAGEKFEVRTLTQKEKREFFYIQQAGKTSFTVGEMVKIMKPYIYKSFTELPALATKAKENGLIKSYYDIVEELFNAEELIDIIEFISEINKIFETNAVKEIEEIKKQ